MSNRTMSCARLLHFPPLPELPEPLHGQALAAVEVAHQCGLAGLNAAMAQLREHAPDWTPLPRYQQRAYLPCTWIHQGQLPTRANGMLLDDLEHFASWSLLDMPDLSNASSIAQ